MNKTYLYAGAGVAALVGAWFVFGRTPSTDAEGLPQYTPIVYSGAGAATGGATSEPSADNSLSQLLASQVAQLTIQSDAARYQLDTQKAIAFGGFQSALDLANVDLAKEKVSSLASIWRSMFGAGGAEGGALNVKEPTSSSTMFGGGFGFTSGSTGGFTRSRVKGFTGFDDKGNITVDIEKETGSSREEFAPRNETTPSFAPSRSFSIPPTQRNVAGLV